MLPAAVGTSILKVDMKHCYYKVIIWDFNTTQIERMLVMIFGPIPLLFFSFPLPTKLHLKKLANMCIIATGGIIGRLYCCILTS